MVYEADAAEEQLWRNFPPGGRNIQQLPVEWVTSSCQATILADGHVEDVFTLNSVIPTAIKIISRCLLHGGLQRYDGGWTTVGPNNRIALEIQAGLPSLLGQNDTLANFTRFGNLMNAPTSNPLNDDTTS